MVAKKLTKQAVELAMALWVEQVMMGIGDETPDVNLLDEWLANRCYGYATLEAAAQGDVEALAEVRMEAGLPLFV